MGTCFVECIDTQENMHVLWISRQLEGLFWPRKILFARVTSYSPGLRSWLRVFPVFDRWVQSSFTVFFCWVFMVSFFLVYCQFQLKIYIRKEKGTEFDLYLFYFILFESYVSSLILVFLDLYLLVHFMLCDYSFGRASINSIQENSLYSLFTN